jgi:hypothetical protein
MIRKIGKTLLQQLCLCAMVVLALDIAMYLFLPATIARTLPGYRWMAGFEPSGGNALMPRDYMSSHPARGFDIRPNSAGMHRVEGRSYKVWSNSLGCFDWQRQEIPTRYTYFAGDSFTWGFAPFDTKFATLFELETGRVSLKCGVTHTGQIHQLAKLKDVMAVVGHPPGHVIVGYVSNDPLNDFAHPHSTVIEGLVVDHTYFDGNFNLAQVDEEWLRGQAVANVKTRPTLDASGNLLRRYSATSHVLQMAWQAWRHPPFHPTISYKGAVLSSIYSGEPQILRTGVLDAENSRFAANKKAILAWRDHARLNGYRLTFVLIPPADHYASKTYFEAVRSFLLAEQVEHVDLTEAFRQSGLGQDEIYWPKDGHFSIIGNRLVGDIMVKRFAN